MTTTTSPEQTAARPCPGCGQGPLQTRRNRQEGSFFLGCSLYPRCRYTEPTAAPPGEPSLQAQTVAELVRALAQLRQVTKERDEARQALANYRRWYAWLRQGLLHLAAKMDPERWEYEACAVEVSRQIAHCLEVLYGAKGQEALAQDTARCADAEAQRQDCLNPACVGCAERRFAWRDPKAREIPCLEDGEPDDTG
jgi:hypothetical protein